MNKTILAIAVAICLVPGLAQAADLPPGVDKAGDVTPAAAYNWDGTRAIAANVTGFTNGNIATCGLREDQTGVLGQTVQPDYCEHILVRFDLPFPDGSSALTYKKSMQVAINTFDPATVTDFDLRLFESDANGTKGTTGTTLFSGQDPIAEAQAGGQVFDKPEQVTVPLTSKRTYNPDGTVKTETSTFWYLVEVVYFQAPNATYKGTAKFL